MCAFFQVPDEISRQVAVCERKNDLVVDPGLCVQWPGQNNVSLIGAHIDDLDDVVGVRDDTKRQGVIVSVNPRQVENLEPHGHILFQPENLIGGG